MIILLIPGNHANYYVIQSQVQVQIKISLLNLVYKNEMTFLCLVKIRERLDQFD